MAKANGTKAHSSAAKVKPRACGWRAAVKVHMSLVSRVLRHSGGSVELIGPLDAPSISPGSYRIR